MTKRRGRSGGEERAHIPISEDRVREQLSQLIDRATSTELPTDARGLQRLIDSVGGRSQLAQILSGTSDKKARAYKSQRDYISRVLRGGRGIGARKASKLKEAGRKATASRLRSRGQIKVNIQAGFKAYDQVWNGTAYATLSEEHQEEFLSLLETGDDAALLDFVMDQYDAGSGYASMVEDIEGFEGFSIE